MSASVLSYLRHLLPTSGDCLPDGELLRHFAAEHQQEAFTELLRRHGPLVWGVCRRVLGDAHAAEDAFQATFLQLARQAGTLIQDRSLAGWLHTVATRLAGRAVRAEQRRRQRERIRGPIKATAADELTWRELRQILDGEIARLPEPYRQPLILCYLENQTHAEAARRLGLAPAVLRGRLERGRQKLRSRLEKLGLPLAAILLLSNSEAVPAALPAATRQMVARVLAGAAVPPNVAALLSGGTVLSRWMAGLLAILLLAAGGIGMGGVRQPADSPTAPPRPQEPPHVRDNDKERADPLPPGAIRRLGTLRHRIQNWPLTWHGLPDGKSYLSVHQVRASITLPGEIRRHDAATGRILETWRVPDLYRVVAFSPDGRFALMENEFVEYLGFRRPGVVETQERMVRLYDLAKRETIWENRATLERKDWTRIASACFSTDDKWIVTAGSDDQGILRLWDAATGKPMWQHKRNLEALGFADGDRTVIVRDQSNIIHLFDRASGKARRSFSTMLRDQAWQCTLAPDGSAILFGTVDSVRVWDVATGKERTPLTDPKRSAWRFAFSPGGKLLVVGAGPSTSVRAWPSGETLRTIALGRRGVERLAVSGDGRRLEVLFGGEQALHFYDLKTGKEQPAPQDGHEAAVYSVAFAPDGTLLSYGRDATMRNWDVKKGHLVGRMSFGQNSVECGCAISRDGRLLAVPDSKDNAVEVYERASGKRRSKLSTEVAFGRRLVFSPDGKWLAAADRWNSRITVWDATAGRVVLKLADRVAYGVSCAFRPDGRQFAASAEGAVRFWDVPTWKEQQGLTAYAPLGLAYSPDARTLATLSVEGVRLFELATRRQRAHFQPKDYPTGAVHFSPGGRWLAWIADGIAIHVWDLQRGEQLARFTGHDDAITDLVFTADERALVSASQDSTLLVWDLDGPAAKAPRPQSGDVEKAWQALGREDAASAYEAIWVLAASPDAAIPLLASHLKPIFPLDTKRVNAWLRDLESEDFATRERAMRALEQFGDAATPALRQFLTDHPSLEARRRAEQLLRKISNSTPERLRQMRALEALERIGSLGARRLLEDLARGDPAARLTHDSQTALKRLRHNPKVD